MNSNFDKVTFKRYVWTEDAKECLKRNCICKGCFFEKFFTPADGRYREPVSKCKMKETVRMLISKIGVP